MIGDHTDDGTPDAIQIERLGRKKLWEKQDVYRQHEEEP
jgi:hypothetical protein